MNGLVCLLFAVLGATALIVGIGFVCVTVVDEWLMARRLIRDFEERLEKLERRRPARRQR